MLVCAFMLCVTALDLICSSGAAWVGGGCMCRCRWRLCIPTHCVSFSFSLSLCGPHLAVNSGTESVNAGRQVVKARLGHPLHPLQNESQQGIVLLSSSPPVCCCRWAPDCCCRQRHTTASLTWVCAPAARVAAPDRGSPLQVLVLLLCVPVEDTFAGRACTRWRCTHHAAGVCLRVARRGAWGGAGTAPPLRLSAVAFAFRLWLDANTSSQEWAPWNPAAPCCRYDAGPGCKPQVGCFAVFCVCVLLGNEGLGGGTGGCVACRTPCGNPLLELGACAAPSAAGWVQNGSTSKKNPSGSLFDYQHQLLSGSWFALTALLLCQHPAAAAAHLLGTRCQQSSCPCMAEGLPAAKHAAMH